MYRLCAVVISLSSAMFAAGSHASAVPIDDGKIQFISNFGQGNFQVIESDVLLPETTIPDPDIPTLYHAAFAEISEGAIRMSLFENSVYAELNAAVRDTYIVHGANPGESVTLTVQLDVDGEFSTGPTAPSTGSVTGWIGGDLSGGSLSSGGLLPSPLIAPAGFTSGQVSEYLNAGETLPVHLPISTVIDVDVGDTFTLAYKINLQSAGGEWFGDFRNTATVSFNLPPGVSLTSENGFGAPVPEPSTFAMAVSGLLILGGVSVHRRRSKRRPA